MISVHRSASILPGKLTSAVATAKQLAVHFKDLTGVEASVSMPIGGNPNRIGWTSRYANLAALEAAMGKMMADPKFQELAAKGGENFIAGSMHDEIWREI
jgi:hypothetical protein